MAMNKVICKAMRGNFEVYSDKDIGTKRLKASFAASISKE